MDWGVILSQVILGVVGIIVSALGVIITNLINKKIKDEQLKKIVNGISNITLEAVEYVYQIYVENIKGTSLWNKEAMKNASDQALDYVKENLPKEAWNYLKNNYKDVEAWLRSQIEIMLQRFKANK